MFAELKNIHQVHDWLMKENSVSNLGEVNRAKLKMFHWNYFENSVAETILRCNKPFLAFLKMPLKSKPEKKK